MTFPERVDLGERNRVPRFDPTAFIAEDSFLAANGPVRTVVRRSGGASSDCPPAR